jgi:hypothetical protein
MFFSPTPHLPTRVPISPVRQLPTWNPPIPRVPLIVPALESCRYSIDSQLPYPVPSCHDFHVPTTSSLFLLHAPSTIPSVACPKNQHRAYSGLVRRRAGRAAPIQAVDDPFMPEFFVVFWAHTRRQALAAEVEGWPCPPPRHAEHTEYSEEQVVVVVPVEQRPR